MRWFEKYTNKRLAQLKSDVIRKRWQTIELEKAVDNIHQSHKNKRGLSSIYNIVDLPLFYLNICSLYAILLLCN